MNGDSRLELTLVYLLKVAQVKLRPSDSEGAYAVFSASAVSSQAPTARLSEQPASGMPTPPAVGEDQSSGGVRSRLWGAQTSAAAAGDSVMVSQKTQQALPMCSSNHAPPCLPRGIKNLRPHRTLHGMLTAALFIIAKMWKRPRCPSVGDGQVNCGPSRQ